MPAKRPVMLWLYDKITFINSDLTVNVTSHILPFPVY